MTYSRRDWLFSGLLSLFVLLLAMGSVTTGVTDWGDDFAGYINEGTAIADGRFEEQVALNYEQHPTPFTKETQDHQLVYAWGYPLMQAAVYKLFGFDRINYSSVIWYKAPLVLSLSLLAGVLYLFYRRRFRPEAAVFLALLFCVSGDLFEAINELYSDLPFLFVSILVLLLMECYSEDNGNWKVGMVYGVALWLAHEIRLNGLTICAVAAIGHILLQGKDMLDRKTLWRNLMPYVVFAVLCIITEHLWLAPATSNMSDVGSATVEEMFQHCQYYWNRIVNYLSCIPGMRIDGVGYVAVALCVLGIIVKGFSREGLHLTLLLIGTLAVVIMLPYTQGLRYIYNILPIVLMYVVYGAQFIIERARRLFREAKTAETIGRILIYAIAAEMLFFPCAAQMTRDYINLTHWGEKDEFDVYTDEAIEAYRFIQADTPEDAVIAFAKPRALYMNTQRRSFRPGINGHELTDADYFLYCKLSYGDFPEISPMAVNGKPVMDNDWFTLIRLNGSGL